MEVVEVVERRAGAFQDVLTVVAPKILSKCVIVPRSGHELPEPRRLHAGERFGLKGTLDERQQRELRRHVARFDVFDDVVEVLPRTRGHTLDVRGILRVVGHPSVDER